MEGIVNQLHDKINELAKEHEYVKIVDRLNLWIHIETKYDLVRLAKFKVLGLAGKSCRTDHFKKIRNVRLIKLALRELAATLNVRIIIQNVNSCDFTRFLVGRYGDYRHKVEIEIAKCDCHDYV